MKSVFVSTPLKLGTRFMKGFERFLRVLESEELAARTLGKTDYPIKTVLDEVIALMDRCLGAIVLGYPQGRAETKKGPFLLPTEWNQIEAALAYAKGLPLLAIHHPKVERGVFDRGTMASFLYEVDLGNPQWPTDDHIQGAIRTWKSRLPDRFLGRWGYREHDGDYTRQFTAEGICILTYRKGKATTRKWERAYTLNDEGNEATVDHGPDGRDTHKLGEQDDGPMTIEAKDGRNYAARRLRRACESLTRQPIGPATRS